MPEAYVICATPRTGSTLLCNLLASTGTTGNPNSFFRRQDIAEWAAEWNVHEWPEGDTFQRAYLAAAIAAGKGACAIYGMRLMHDSLAELSAVLDRLYPGLASDRARLEKAFGELLFIHLSRDDKLGQAISLVKAQQTGLWHMAPDGTEIERIAPHKEPEYDFRWIRRELTGLETTDAAWRTWFRQNGITALQVNYRDLSVNPAAKLARICEALGVRAPDADGVRPGVAKLADLTSDEWMRRYRLDSAEA